MDVPFKLPTEFISLSTILFTYKSDSIRPRYVGGRDPQGDFATNVFVQFATS